MATMKREDKDGFFGEHHTTAYYLKRLAKLGAPEYIMELAKGLTSSKKSIDQDVTGQDGSRLRTKWDGYQLYHYECGDWGFSRLAIEPDLGYVDYGFGYTE